MLPASKTLQGVYKTGQHYAHTASSRAVFAEPGSTLNGFAIVADDGTMSTLDGIERDEDLFVFVKDARAGPLVLWYTDANKKIRVITDDDCEYVLGRPCKAYAPFMEDADGRRAAAALALMRLRGKKEFTNEEMSLLCTYPQTVIDSVRDYDQWSGPKEKKLWDRLVETVGTDEVFASALREYDDEEEDEDEEKKTPKDKNGEMSYRTRHEGSLAVVTPLVERVFGSYFVRGGSSSRETKRRRKDDEEEDDEDEEEEEEEGEDDDAEKTPFDSIPRVDVVEVVFGEVPACSDERCEYFRVCTLIGKNKEIVTVGVGDIVLVDHREQNAPYVVPLNDAGDEEDVWPMQINYMWRDRTSGSARLCGLRLVHGSSTVLGDAASQFTLFALDQCTNVDIGGSVVAKLPESFSWTSQYDPKATRFETPHGLPLLCKEAWKTLETNEVVIRKSLETCYQRMRELEDTVVENGKSVTCGGRTYFVGSGALIFPSAYTLSSARREDNDPTKSARKQLTPASRFPEAWRLDNEPSRKSAHDGTKPFLVGMIVGVSNESIAVRKLYRPEDTNLSLQRAFQYSIHELFLSDEEITFVPLEELMGPCHIRVDANDESIPRGVKEPFFFVRNAYINGKITSLPQYAENHFVAPVDPPAPPRPLACLDIFAGCGGLSSGLHASGACESKWAIEFDPPAAKSYKANFPGATVFTEDCNSIMRRLLANETTSSDGQRLPKKGEVEAIVGGPPCQGFSAMNRFNDREYSRFKNSLVASYLSYCDYFRPKLLLMENVLNFSMYNRGAVVQMCLRTLIEMGYQVTCSNMQAGAYGVPQSRRRFVILASRADVPLPRFPRPKHTFARSGMLLSAVVNGYRVNSFANDIGSAPYRRMTVRDALGDLPAIESGESREKIRYTRAPQTDYQRAMRSANLTTVTSHHCIALPVLSQARIDRVPILGDWRWLPNDVVTLSDGTKTDKLVYTGKPHDKCGGVGEQNQKNTLIPWALVHTANRNNNWRGLWGRVDYEGYFATTTTRSAPAAKQGCGVHPEQNRMLSVRENARSQSFRDDFVFLGTLVERFRMVGNAVAPRMAEAIGEEWVKCLR